jgi:hypothetical protein
VWPNGKSRNRARGGFAERVMENALDRLSVETPLPSISLAISPTD